MVDDKDEVMVPNFGTFKLKKTPARVVLHPVTREECFIPESLKLDFKPSITLSKKIREAAEIEADAGVTYEDFDEE